LRPNFIVQSEAQEFVYQSSLGRFVTCLVHWGLLSAEDWFWK